MDADWVKSPMGRRIRALSGDPRPAWLWSADGQKLIWRNTAARFFGTRAKTPQAAAAREAAPIKGQVSRLMRLGAVGRTSLSRIQFLVGEKPVSATCECTPLEVPDTGLAMLLVGVDAIAPAVPADAGVPDALTRALFPEDEPVPVEQPVLAPEPVTEAEPAADAVSPLAVEGAAPQQPVPEPVVIELHTPSPEPEAEEEATPRSLSALFDRLAGDAELYSPLDADDEAEPVTTRYEAPVDGQLAADIAAASAEPEEKPEPADAPEVEPETRPTLWRVTGRRFAALHTDDELDYPPPAPVTIEPEPLPVEPVPEVPPPADADAVERVSRYNFDELSRILADRVSADEPELQQTPVTEIAAPPAPVQAVANHRPEGQLVSLAGETFILNRLPLGILVFRDQQVLFANRSITEMTGYGTIDELRQAGLAAIFPAAGAEAPEAGPVNHLMQRDGTLVPVTARLQSISWQGRPALMLSASATEVRTSHEAAVRAFAELLAETRGDGFVEATRPGVISQISASALVALGLAGQQLSGRPLSALVAPEETPALKAFLERPARFAETARPALALKGMGGDADILLFAQGQAGIVAGYFGLVRPREESSVPALVAPDADVEPNMLARVSRGVRRPLNTIIGFADMIRSSAFATDDSQRTLEYARDIKTAGLEIAALVDELDDFARLKDGRYAARPADLDLGALLESCVVRVRGQASTARVLVRSAISERLPRIRADRASLGQAVLNLLASAIDQTPPGASVILSAQLQDDGSIVVNVRDASDAGADMGERFLVFRDGVDRDGSMLAPVRSSVGLALTRSLLAVNSTSLSVDPAGATGTIFSLLIPADLVVPTAIS